MTHFDAWLALGMLSTTFLVCENCCSPLSIGTNHCIRCGGSAGGSLLPMLLASCTEAIEAVDAESLLRLALLYMKVKFSSAQPSLSEIQELAPSFREWVVDSLRRIDSDPEGTAQISRGLEWE